MSLLRSTSFLAAIILVLGGLVTAANAQQYSPGMAMRANMPTSFMVGNKIMPAGQYKLRRIGSSSRAAPNQLLITDNHGNSAFIIGQAGEEGTWPAAHDAIELRRVGGEYYLSRILWGGQFTGLTIPVPKARGEYIGRNKGPEKIVVTMSSE